MMVYQLRMRQRRHVARVEMLAHSQSGRASNNSFTSSRDGRVVFVEDIISVS